MSREELEDKMAVLLGGRAAEWIVFGNLTTGAADDLRRVTDLARSMVTRYGMSTALGPIAYEQERGSMLGLPPTSLGYPERRDYAEVTATAIDEEVRGIVQAAFDRTVALLQERRQILDVAAQRLLESESLNEHELLELVGTVFPATHNLNQEANDEMTPADQQS